MKIDRYILYDKKRTQNTVKKCSKNTSKKVQNSKISYPAEGDTPFTRTQPLQQTLPLS